MNDNQTKIQCENCECEATESHVILREAHLCQNCSLSVTDEDVDIPPHTGGIDAETVPYISDTLCDSNDLLMCLFIGLTKYDEHTKGPTVQPFITLVETLMDKIFVLSHTIQGKDE